MEKYFLKPYGAKWVLSKEGNDTAVETFDNKEDAIKQSARFIEKDGEGSLIIMRQDGTFDEERTYPISADPKETEG